MASFFLRGMTALVVLGWAGSTAFAAPPKRSVPTSRRPTTTKAPTPAKPSVKPTAPLTITPSTTPAPTPPQPRRDDAAAVPTKAAIPHPAVAAEVKSAPVEVKPAPVEVRPDADGKYALRYHFSAGETVRWKIEQQARIVTSVAVPSDSGVQGATQTADTVTISTKAWRIVELLPGGEVRFIPSVEAIDMRQKLTGRQEVKYDSATDKDVPPLFAEAAKQVGVPLGVVTIDARGTVIKHESNASQADNASNGAIVLVLPDRPLAVGESWTSPFNLTATDADGTKKIVKARNKLTLEKVTDGIALIRNETQILSPIDDPAVEAQVAQAEQAGQVLFDLRRGRIVEQSSALDKAVFGFQGPESKLHYTTQFSEKLIDANAATTAEATGAEPAAIVNS